MNRTAAEWEQLWAPYDQATYDLALRCIAPQDIILEIGAGDLRLACQAARIARRVYAVEINLAILERGARTFAPLPDNLEIIHADAKTLDIPNGVTLGVLLMRHCTHFGLYAAALRQVGCRRLVTNARWRMGVEVIDFEQAPILYNKAQVGWYACQCGAVGFKDGPLDDWSIERDALTQEVCACPACKKPELQGVDE
ncbi:MAG: class I SAM-dependent methyltransferase [Chloroflexota bacterium]